MTVAYICDIILVLILVVALVNGTRQGFVQTIVGLLLNIITIVVVVAFLNPVRVFLLKFVDLAKWFGEDGNLWKNFILSAGNYLVATLIIFAIISLIMTVIMTIARRRVEDRRIDSPSFAKWDRGLGFLGGLINGLMSCALISIIVSQPLFFPTIQEDVDKTTITSFVYNVSEKAMSATTGLNDEELTNAMIAYFMGSSIEDSKEEESSTYRMSKIASMVLEIESFTKNPERFIKTNGEAGVAKFVIYISALADVVAMSPENKSLDEHFIKLYDFLVGYIPNGVDIIFTEEQYYDMFDRAEGSFYNAGLSAERIAKVEVPSCIEVCYH